MIFSTIKSKAKSQIKNNLFAFTLHLTLPLLLVQGITNYGDKNTNRLLISISLLSLLSFLIEAAISHFTYQYAKSNKKRDISIFSIINNYKIGTIALTAFLQSVIPSLIFILSISAGRIPLIGWVITTTGFIAAFISIYCFSQATFIAIDKEVTAVQALSQSNQLMKNHKFELFLLHLSFIGWIFLIIITFGLAVFYVLPYIYMTQTNYYLKLTNQ